MNRKMKKLVSALMALSLTCSLAPMALADTTATGPGPVIPSHNYDTGTWKSDESRHWHACTDAGCDAQTDSESHNFDGGTVTLAPTCFSKGLLTYTCQTCGRVKTEEIATTAHSFVESRWEFNDTQHWHECAYHNDGCAANSGAANHAWSETTLKESTCTVQGTVQRTCTVCGATNQAAKALRSHVDANGDGRCDVCGTSVATNVVVTFQTGSGTTQQTVTKGGKPTRPANPTRSGNGWSYSFKGWTTSATSSYVYIGQSLTTVENVAVQQNTTYYAVYAVQATGQNVTMTLSGNGAITADTSTLYSSSFRSQMYSRFASVTGHEMTKVLFNSPAANSSGTLYTNSGGTGLNASVFYYYSSPSYGTYPLSSVYYQPTGNSGTYSIGYSAFDEQGNVVSGTLSFILGNGANINNNQTIVYTVEPGDEVEFDMSDFNKVYQTGNSGTLRWVTFSTSSTLNESNGMVYYDKGGRDEESFNKSSIDDYKFYYNDDSYGDYALDDLCFAAEKGASHHTVTLSFRAHYSSSRYTDGTLEIQVGGSGDAISYSVDPEDEKTFEREDFNNVFQRQYNQTVRYVTFTASKELDSAEGTLYYDYGGSDERTFTRGNIDDYTFYYSNSSYGEFPLDELTYVADSDFDSTITLSFRAYYNSATYVDGTLTIKPGSDADRENQGDIRYYTTSGAGIQLSANDFARFFNQKYPNYTFDHIVLEDVPDEGELYYNYYNASDYGSSKLLFTYRNCDNESLYFSPDSSKEYALSELTYVPDGSNYCDVIPFTAYASGSRSVSGTVLVSVSRSLVPDVYGVAPRGSSVDFPASAIYSAVSTGTGQKLTGIQLLALPDSGDGTVYVGSGSGTKASTDTVYTYSGGSRRMSQLRFVPASGFTGSVELPYVAYNDDDDAIAAGKFCLGVVNKVTQFKDLSASSWCYKYVTELSDADVISGYQDGTFRPNDTVTYGAALKLIMLAAGYPEQAPTGTNWASGYFTAAKANGLVSGNVDLSKPISRLAVAQIAAKAMRLDTDDLSSVEPFTDTSDRYVQALNAAGIVEGYFSNGTSTFKPGNTLTRGQIAAIVWRMERAA